MTRAWEGASRRAGQDDVPLRPEDEKMPEFMAHDGLSHAHASQQSNFSSIALPHRIAARRISLIESSEILSTLV